MCYCVNSSKQSSLQCCKENSGVRYIQKTQDVNAVHSIYNKYPRPFQILPKVSTTKLLSITLKQLLQILPMQSNLSILKNASKLVAIKSALQTVQRKV